MTKFRLRGVYPALVTPFTKDDNVDEVAYRKLIQAVLGDVEGIVVAGTTGEFVYLSVEERKRLFEIAVDEVRGRKPVIAGTGAASTKTAIELAKVAADAGVDACLVVCPYFIGTDDKGIHEHFYRLAQKSELPIILYNIPQTAGRYIPRRVVEDLARIDNIIGLKDSSGDLTYTLELLEKVEGRIDIVIGHDEVVLPALAAGCSGMILASAQVFPDIWQKVFAAVHIGDLETARALQMKVQKLARIFCRLGGPVPVKAALGMMGLDMGKTRMPLKIGGALVHEDREEIRLELEKIGKVKHKESEVEQVELPLEQRFEDVGIPEDAVKKEGLAVGSSEAGTGIERVKMDLVAGSNKTSIAKAFAVQLTSPRHGYEALTIILEPNLTIRPASLVVPTVKLKNLRQANMIYGPSQSAIGRAVADCLESNVIPESVMNSHLMIFKVFMHPDALDRQKLYENNYAAASEAIKGVFSKGVR